MILGHLLRAERYQIRMKISLSFAVRRSSAGVEVNWKGWKTVSGYGWGEISGGCQTELWNDGIWSVPYRQGYQVLILKKKYHYHLLFGVVRLVSALSSRGDEAFPGRLWLRGDKWWLSRWIVEWWYSTCRMIVHDGTLIRNPRENPPNAESSGIPHSPPSPRKKTFMFFINIGDLLKNEPK